MNVDRFEHRVVCEGNCEPHTGDVTRVHVWHGYNDWGQFWYCETACQTDRDNGMTVEPAENEEAAT